MVNTRRIAALALMAAAVSLTASLTACGKKTEPPKTAEQLKAEKEATAKTVRDNPVWGDQVKAMDKAKAVTDQAVKAQEEQLKKAD